LKTIFKYSKKFIKQYFYYSGKSTKELERFLENSEPNRLLHTLSIFLFGLTLYYNSSKINNEINKFIDKSNKEVKTNRYEIKTNFNYWWFLICFIHDIGYAYNEKFTDFELFQKNSESEIKEEVKSILKNISDFSKDCIPEVIIDSWEKYLEFKENSKDSKIKEKIDHGILSGAYYIYTLNKVFEEKSINNTKRVDRNGGFTDENKLYWSKKMIDCVHKPIAWIIAAHNIWYKNLNYENTNEYDKEDLKELIIEEPLVKLEKYPLYFLLCLVDTLDPIKYLMKTTDKFSNLKINEVLEDIVCNINDDYIEIKFKDALKSYNEGYSQKNSKIDNWMDIKILNNKV